MKSLFSLSVIALILFSNCLARVFVDPARAANPKAPKRSHQLYLHNQVHPVKIQLKNMAKGIFQLYPSNSRH